MDVLRRTAILLCGIGFIISTVALTHYIVNIEMHYNDNPDLLTEDLDTVGHALWSNGCLSKKEIRLSTDFGYLRAWYLASEYTKKRGSYRNGEICIFNATPSTTP